MEKYVHYRIINHQLKVQADLYLYNTLILNNYQI